PGIGEETPYRLKERPHQQRLQAIAKMPTATKLTLCFIAACALLDSLSCRAAAAPHAGNVKRALELLQSRPIEAAPLRGSSGRSLQVQPGNEAVIRSLKSYLRQSRQDPDLDPIEILMHRQQDPQWIRDWRDGR
uniref:PSCyt2 domain-containing protein n=1 Tax=Macrostomum lignano TaxID=282301 RepID=A0A1I8HT83_9PLAT